MANQILYQYDQNGQLKREYTSHSGAVDIQTTPFIEHGYDSITNSLKPISLTYPSGKEISYGYDFAGRVTTISDGIVQTDSGSDDSYGSSGSSGLPPVVEGDIVVRYFYQGIGSPMKTEYVKPGLTLDYTASGALDRFGRITDHAWKDDQGSDVVRIKHDYDLAGNRLNRIDMMNSNWSETYAYDGMDQIKSLQRNGHAESWDHDPTGNWLSYNKNNIVQDRQHNKANEIQSIVTHDRNGNMTQMPSPKDDQAMNCVYDAWNRLVKINENIRYEYDGLNHRIAKTVDGVKTLSFFNSDWQELESRSNDVTTTCLWGLRYIDDLIYRERNEERLYSLADPNWNVVTVCNEDGFVEERFHYNAFGKVNGLNSDWNRTFTGQVLDHETGLMLYRNRLYHVDLGKFVRRAPIGYEANDENLYRYIINSSTLSIDPMGLQKTCVKPPCSDLPQPSSGPIILKYLGRCFLSGNLRNRSGKNMTVSNVFNHPTIIQQMEKVRQSLESEICAPENNNKTNFNGDAGNPHFPPGDLGSFEWLINNFGFSYTASVKPSPKKGCFDIEITWKFEDHIDAKTFKDLKKENNGKLNWLGDFWEGAVRNCIQNPMNSNFHINAEKQESFSVCCCKE